MTEQEIREMNSKQSFIKGYQEVKAGRITRDLSAREIESQYGKVKTDSFSNGIIDALANDSFRYDLVNK